MNGWREIVKFLRIDAPLWKHGPMDYLESRGYRFCVDFGYDNAIEKARQDWNSRKRRRDDRRAR